MRKIFASLCILSVLFMYSATAKAADGKQGNMVTEEGAWCWFADPRALHYENKTGTINSSYIGYIDVHGNIKATQYNFLTGKRSEVLIRSYFQPDDHDNPTFLVLPDERVMIFYSRHTDEACFYYRISRNPGDISSLGAEKKIVTANNTTYPSPFILADDPDHIYLCWRGINWHPTIAKLSIPDENDNTSVSWGPYQIVQSTGARPYAKYYSNGKDKIYLTYTTGHPDNENPNWIYFNYINVNTLKLEDVKGNVLSTIANGPFQVKKDAAYGTNYPSTVVENSSYRNWVWQVAADKEGKPAIAMVRINDGKTSHDYYYAKWTGTEWKKTFLANGGGHFHQTSGLEMCYSGGMTLDPEKPNEVYASVPVTGTSGKVYEIMKYVVDESTWQVTSTAITQNSTKNNSRPYMLPGSANSPLRLSWMHGDYYDWIVSSTRPKGYPTAIYSDFNVFTEAVALDEGLVKSELFNGEVEGTAKTSKGTLVVEPTTFATLKVEKTPSFTITLSPYINAESYGGIILQFAGALSYRLDPTTQVPFVTVGSSTRVSTNLLATADCWQTAARGTGGQWYTPQKHKFFNLTLTYAEGVLTTYVNGLIDQVITFQTPLTLDSVVLGGFKGWIEDCHIYNRALNQNEIQYYVNETKKYSLNSELLNAIELDALSVPSRVVTDIVLPTKSASGSAITWTSSNPSAITTTGLVTLIPDLAPAVAPVTLKATIGSQSREFQTMVLPRNINNNKLLVYTFEEADVYTEAGVRYVRDKSGNGRDLAVYGSAKVNGALDLTANTASGFSANGYAIAPAGVLDSLRSYTFFLKVNPKNLDKQPRLYDFGSASSNSVFGRGSKLTAGVKYNGESTKMVDSPTALSLNMETSLAFTFDARTKVTKIYMNGVEKVSGTTITNEPYQVAAIGADKRNYLGRAQWWDTSESGNNIDYCGIIDDFRLYNIALTTDEILLLLEPTSTSEVSMPETLTFYPNSIPCNGSAQMAREFTQDELKGLKVEVIDMQGKIIQSFNPTGSPIVIEGISLSGIYLVQVTNQQQQLMTGRLVVQ